MKINLTSGNIGLEANSTNQNDRRALLVYAGTFKSADGDVTVTPAHIEVLIANHNAKLSALGDLIKIGDYPPVQLDHSTSARDTVGRLVGPLELGTHDGKVALFGYLRMLGVENFEKVADGRWTHLSIGADLETGELQEITITPFPAAKNASLLSEKGLGNMSKKLNYLMEKEKISEDEAKEKLCKMTDDEKKELSKFAGETDDEHEKSESEEKEKKEEAAKLSAEKEENEKKEKEEEAKLAAEKEEKEAEEKKKAVAAEENKTKLSAALKGFQEKSVGLKIALRTANIQTRIVRLKAQAKISPAEIKKIDFVKLAAANDETVEAVIKTYEQREPVIHVGQFGSLKASNASEIAKNIKLSALEDETRQNMSLTRNKTGAKTKLSSEPATTSNNNKVEEITMVGDHSALWQEIVEAIKSGDEPGAKAIFVKACKMQSGEDISIDESSMAALMSSFASLEDNCGTVVRLAGETSGIKL